MAKRPSKKRNPSKESRYSSGVLLKGGNVQYIKPKVSQAKRITEILSDPLFGHPDVRVEWNQNQARYEMIFPDGRQKTLGRNIKEVLEATRAHLVVRNRQALRGDLGGLLAARPDVLDTIRESLQGNMPSETVMRRLFLGARPAAAFQRSLESQVEETVGSVLPEEKKEELVAAVRIETGKGIEEDLQAVESSIEKEEEIEPILPSAKVKKDPVGQAKANYSDEEIASLTSEQRDYLVAHPEEYNGDTLRRFIHAEQGWPKKKLKGTKVSELYSLVRSGDSYEKPEKKEVKKPKEKKKTETTEKTSTKEKKALEEELVDSGIPAMSRGVRKYEKSDLKKLDEVLTDVQESHILENAEEYTVPTLKAFSRRVMGLDDSFDTGESFSDGKKKPNVYYVDQLKKDELVALVSEKSTKIPTDLKKKIRSKYPSSTEVKSEKKTPKKVKEKKVSKVPSKEKILVKKEKPSKKDNVIPLKPRVAGIAGLSQVFLSEGTKGLNKALEALNKSALNQMLSSLNLKRVEDLNDSAKKKVFFTLRREVKKQPYTIVQRAARVYGERGKEGFIAYFEDEEDFGKTELVKALSDGSVSTREALDDSDIVTNLGQQAYISVMKRAAFSRLCGWYNSNREEFSQKVKDSPLGTLRDYAVIFSIDTNGMIAEQVAGAVIDAVALAVKHSTTYQEMEASREKNIDFSKQLREGKYGSPAEIYEATGLARKDKLAGLALNRSDQTLMGNRILQALEKGEKPLHYCVSKSPRQIQIPRAAELSPSLERQVTSQMLGEFPQDFLDLLVVGFSGNAEADEAIEEAMKGMLSSWKNTIGPFYVSSSKKTSTLRKMVSKLTSVRKNTKYFKTEAETRKKANILYTFFVLFNRHFSMLTNKALNEARAGLKDKALTVEEMVEAIVKTTKQIAEGEKWDSLGIPEIRWEETPESKILTKTSQAQKEVRSQNLKKAQKAHEDIGAPSFYDRKEGDVIPNRPYAEFYHSARETMVGTGGLFNHLGTGFNQEDFQTELTGFWIPIYNALAIGVFSSGPYKGESLVDVVSVLMTKGHTAPQIAVLLDTPDAESVMVVDDETGKEVKLRSILHPRMDETESDFVFYAKMLRSFKGIPAAKDQEALSQFETIHSEKLSRFRERVQARSHDAVKKKIRKEVLRDSVKGYPAGERDLVPNISQKRLDEEFSVTSRGKKDFTKPNNLICIYRFFANQIIPSGVDSIVQKEKLFGDSVAIDFSGMSYIDLVLLNFLNGEAVEKIAKQHAGLKSYPFLAGMKFCMRDGDEYAPLPFADLRAAYAGQKDRDLQRFFEVSIRGILEIKGIPTQGNAARKWVRQNKELGERLVSKHLVVKTPKTTQELVKTVNLPLKREDLETFAISSRLDEVYLFEAKGKYALFPRQTMFFDVYDSKTAGQFGKRDEFTRKFSKFKKDDLVAFLRGDEDNPSFASIEKTVLDSFAFLLQKSIFKEGVLQALQLREAHHLIMDEDWLTLSAPVGNKNDRERFQNQISAYREKVKLEESDPANTALEVRAVVESKPIAGVGPLEFRLFDFKPEDFIKLTIFIFWDESSHTNRFAILSQKEIRESLANNILIREKARELYRPIQKEDRFGFEITFDKLVDEATKRDGSNSPFWDKGSPIQSKDFHLTEITGDELEGNVVAYGGIGRTSYRRRKPERETVRAPYQRMGNWSVALLADVLHGTFRSVVEFPDVGSIFEPLNQKMGKRYGELLKVLKRKRPDLLNPKKNRLYQPVSASLQQSRIRRTNPSIAEMLLFDTELDANGEEVQTMTHVDLVYNRKTGDYDIIIKGEERFENPIPESLLPIRGIKDHEEALRKKAYIDRIVNPLDASDVQALGYRSNYDLLEDLQRVVSALPEGFEPTPHVWKIARGSRTRLEIIEGHGVEKLSARYAIVEADDLRSSYSLQDGELAQNPYYPASLAKLSDPASVLKLAESIANGEISLGVLFNNSPGLDGTPVIEDSGVVLSRQELVLAIAMAYRFKDPLSTPDEVSQMVERIRKEIGAIAGVFGLSQSEFSRFSKPVLVRSVGKLTLSRASELSRLSDGVRIQNPVRDLQIGLPSSGGDTVYFAGGFDTETGRFSFGHDPYNPPLSEPLTSSPADAARLQKASNLLSLTENDASLAKMGAWKQARRLYENGVREGKFSGSELKAFTSVLFGYTKTPSLRKQKKPSKAKEPSKKTPVKAKEAVKTKPKMKKTSKKKETSKSSSDKEKVFLWEVAKSVFDSETYKKVKPALTSWLRSKVGDDEATLAYRIPLSEKSQYVNAFKAIAAKKEKPLKKVKEKTKPKKKEEKKASKKKKPESKSEDEKKINLWKLADEHHGSKDKENRKKFLAFAKNELKNKELNLGSAMSVKAGKQLVAAFESSKKVKKKPSKKKEKSSKKEKFSEAQTVSSLKKLETKSKVLSFLDEKDFNKEELKSIVRALGLGADKKNKKELADRILDGLFGVPDKSKKSTSKKKSKPTKVKAVEAVEGPTREKMGDLPVGLRRFLKEEIDDSMRESTKEHFRQRLQAYGSPKVCCRHKVVEFSVGKYGYDEAKRMAEEEGYLGDFSPSPENRYIIDELTDSDFWYLDFLGENPNYVDHQYKVKSQKLEKKSLGKLMPFKDYTKLAVSKKLEYIKKHLQPVVLRFVEDYQDMAELENTPFRGVKQANINDLSLSLGLYALAKPEVVKELMEMLVSTGGELGTYDPNRKPKGMIAGYEMSLLQVLFYNWLNGYWGDSAEFFGGAPQEEVSELLESRASNPRSRKKRKPRARKILRRKNPAGGNKFNLIDETSNQWRFRVLDPSMFRPGTFRTVQIKPGMQLIVGQLKREFIPTMRRGGRKVFKYDPQSMVLQSYHFSKKKYSKSEVVEFILRHHEDIDDARSNRVSGRRKQKSIMAMMPELALTLDAA